MIDNKTQKAISNILSEKSTNHIIKHACGKKLGWGAHRTVYELKDFPQYVVKFERETNNAAFANVTEWRNYINNKDWDKLGPWLAPCHGISEYGIVMLQERIEHRDKKQYPKKIPSVFTDTKYTNFGWIGDRFVCCDYSFFVQCDLKMKTVKWKG